jgi:DNA-binding response OmpR family regulator
MSDTSCKILIVDGGVDGVSSCAEAVRDLGYQCLRAQDPISAISMIENDAGIGVVIADVSVAFTNEINFLEQLDARFALLRSVVPIVMTDTPSLETAIQAMNANAVDLLVKPLETDLLARALRRALLRRSQLVSIKLLAAFVTAQSPNEREPEKKFDKAHELSADQKLMRLVRKTISFRQRRNEYLGSELFSDPAWDIVLELTLAKLQGEAVPVSSACAAAAVPFSTAYRYIGNLVDQRMVRRWKDPLDQRRVLLELEDDTHSVMSDFLLNFPGFGRSLNG